MRFSVLGFRSVLRIELQSPVVRQACTHMQSDKLAHMQSCLSLLFSHIFYKQINANTVSH